MNRFFAKLFYLVRKDFYEESSYRLGFFLHLASVLMYASAFYFVAKVFSGAAPLAGPLQRYNGDYFSFVLIGLAFTGYMTTGLGAISEAVRNEQVLGTLEYVMTTPTPLWVMLLAKVIWNFIYDSFHLLVYLAFGVFFLGAKYGGANVLALPVILVLSLAAFNGIGMVSAGFIIVFKKGDPVNTFMGMLFVLLGGVYFPVEALPGALRAVSAVLPMTYMLRLMRDACINGAGFAELAPDLLRLTALCAILVPAGMLFFSRALNKARKDGSLSHY